ATWKEMFSGLARTSSTRRTAWSAKPPSPSATKPMTSSPTAYASTPAPAATTVPETSKPRARGSRSSRPNSPSRSFTSAGFTPAARTSTTISPAPASGTGRSISSSPSGPPYWLNTYARDIRTLLGVVLTGCLPCGVGRPGGRPTPALGSGWLGGAHLAGPCRRPGARAVARSIERASTVAAQEPHRVGDDDQHGHLVDEHPDGHRHTAEEDSGEQCRHRDQRDHDVLAHVVDRAPRQRDRPGQLEQGVLHQRDVGRLNGYAGAGRTHRHADVRSGQCRRVVHAVTHHRHCVTLPLQVGHGVQLVLRQETGADLVDAHLGADGPGHRLDVAGEHDHLLDARPVQLPDHLPGIVTHLVGDSDHADHPSVTRHPPRGPTRSRELLPVLRGAGVVAGV